VLALELEGDELLRSDGLELVPDDPPVTPALLELGLEELLPEALELG